MFLGRFETRALAALRVSSLGRTIKGFDVAAIPWSPGVYQRARVHFFGLKGLRKFKFALLHRAGEVAEYFAKQITVVHTCVPIKKTSKSVVRWSQLLKFVLSV